MGEKDGSHLENEGKQALGIHQSEEEPTGKSFDAPGFSAFSEEVKEDATGHVAVPATETAHTQVGHQQCHKNQEVVYKMHSSKILGLRKKQNIEVAHA